MERKKLVLSFIKKVYEYFKNDYMMVADFLEGKSPWDRYFIYEFSIDEDELSTLKFEMETSIIINYKNYIVKPALRTKKIHAIDKDVLDQFTQVKDWRELFYTDNASNLTMQKFFFSLMKNEYDFQESTFHKFHQNIYDLEGIYNDLNERFGLENILSHFEDNYLMNELLEKTYDAFKINLYFEVVHYFNHAFRDTNEEREFLNYLYSLCYASLIYDGNNGMIPSYSPTEHGIIACVEEGISPQENFYYNYEMAITAIEILHSLIENFGDKYDFRHKFKDFDMQNIFRDLDPNYDTKFKSEMMIYDFSIDQKLEEIIDVLMHEKGLDGLFEILKGNESIYDLLFDHDLDPRYEDFFKMQLIRKIYGDAYEAEYYFNEVEPRVLVPHMDDLKTIANSDRDVFCHFFEHGDELIELYAYYHNAEEDVHEAAKRFVYENGQLPVVMSIDPYAHYRYQNIVIDKKIDLENVDTLNELVVLDQNSIYDHLMSNKGAINLLVTNVYEHLLQEPDSEKIANLIKQIECSDDVVADMVKDKHSLLTMIRLFKQYNPDSLTYESVLGLRKGINEEKKMVLKRLKSHNKGEESNK